MLKFGEYHSGVEYICTWTRPLLPGKTAIDRNYLLLFGTCLDLWFLWKLTGFEQGCTVMFSFFSMLFYMLHSMFPVLHYSQNLSSILFFCFLNIHQWINESCTQLQKVTFHVKYIMSRYLCCLSWKALVFAIMQWTLLLCMGWFPMMDWLTAGVE